MHGGWREGANPDLVEMFMYVCFVNTQLWQPLSRFSTQSRLLTFWQTERAVTML